MDRKTEVEALANRTKSLPSDWSVNLTPTADSLPAELRDVADQLDAVATAPSGDGIVFEITSRKALQTPRKAAQLQALRSAVARAPGWNFEVLVIPEPPPPLDTESEIESRIESAKQIASEHPAAAYLIGFTTLEWLLAQMCAANGLDYNHNAYRMTSTLVELGELDEERARLVRQAQGIRNRIAHAVSGPPLSQADVRELIRLIEQVRNRANEDAD